MKITIVTAWIKFIEAMFVTIVPIYLYGWLKGLLICSALTSLLHIVFLLQKQEVE
jgi:hypothetical protein